MGRVIALPTSRNAAHRAPESGSAEILFFTGVRYYRLSDADFAALARPRTRRPAAAKAAAKSVSKAAAPVARKLKQQA